ncbi:hypothetical protein H4R35_003040 [Dimargaris xerosporica]|nr:hypothetical protein H4R35_003040 [Dimargaris xerosporica]
MPVEMNAVDPAFGAAPDTKKPKYEIYGFVIYIVSYLLFGLYLGWAYIPDSVLHSIGVTYYPSRYWAIALPAWGVMLVVFIYLVFYAHNFLNTPPLHSYTTITDHFAAVNPNASHDYLDLEAIPEIQDIPISQANAYLHQ